MLYTMKRALCAFEKKCLLFKDAINSLAFGHKDFTTRLTYIEHDA